MTERTLKQNYFKILSGLYELASEFTVDELERVRYAFRERNHDDHAQVVGALLRIHNSAPLDDVARRQYTKRSSEGLAESSSHRTGNAERRREMALRELLMTPELFPNPKAIAGLAPFGVALKEKESREKYVNRIMAEFTARSAEEKRGFMKMLEEHAARSSPRSFVTKWSALIRDL